MVRAGAELDGLSERAVLDQPAIIARLLAPLPERFAGRWDHGAALEVAAPVGAFASLAEGAVLAGGNAALMETEAGWELLQFREAELVAPETWRLTGLLRGQGGSVPAAAEAGARLVLLDGAVGAATLDPVEVGMDLLWTAGAGAAQPQRHENRAGLPWQPCQLRRAARNAFAASSGYRAGRTHRSMAFNRARITLPVIASDLPR